MDRDSQVTVYGDAKSWTRLSDSHTYTSKSTILQKKKTNKLYFNKKIKIINK